jgi:phosphohistidine phosphatase SixA
MSITPVTRRFLLFGTLAASTVRLAALSLPLAPVRANVAEPPKFILVMRHAEKPEDPRDPDLTPEGVARAEKLAGYIPETFGPPDFIFAAAISKHSARPFETVQPLAKRTGKAIDATIADQDYGALAAGLLSDAAYSGKQIVVCWHHGNIPSLLHALGAKNGDYPDPWNRNVFNLILKVEFLGNKVKVSEVVEPF